MTHIFGFYRQKIETDQIIEGDVVATEEPMPEEASRFAKVVEVSRETGEVIIRFLDGSISKLLHSQITEIWRRGQPFSFGHQQSSKVELA